MFLSSVLGFSVNNDLSDIHILYRMEGRETTLGLSLGLEAPTATVSKLMAKMVRRNPYHCQALPAASAGAIFHSNAFSAHPLVRFSTHHSPY